MKHITVVVPYASHAIADISALMGQHNININDMEADPLGERGIITLEVDRYDDALSALRDAGFEAVPQEAFLVKVEDQPGALAKVAARFKEKGLMIRSLRIVRREEGECLFAINAEKTPEAMELVKDILVA
ncbi:hypothetical protein GC177_07670 [bacterium]|nr:hypothetical protein [bacterium]